jgi:hypothetical protein
LTPFNERGRAVLFDVIAAVEVAIPVEAIVDGDMGGGEFLQGLYTSDFVIAASRCRNGWWKFSARLLSHRPQTRD